MKAITLSLLMLILALTGFAQTPAGPVGPAVQPQPATPVETANPAPAAPSAPAAPAESPVAVDNAKIVVPGDTTIPMILMNTINTKSAFVGQAIYCESIYPITVGNHIIIPKGSSIRGTVTEVIRPGRVKGRAQIGLRFDELILPNGTTRHLRATLAGFGSAGDDKFKPKEGQIEGGGSKGKDAETVARTTIPGAEIGTIVGAAKGVPLEGLGIGSAIGAATGVAIILATRGKDIVLPHGTSLDLELSQPVTFAREEVEPPSRYDEGPSMPRREYGPRN
jgi:type IV secretion system protein VirB10